MQNILFVCSQNKLRSPTAEAVFADTPNWDVRSAGLKNNAEIPVTPEDIEWADYILVMEQTHKTKIQQQFRDYLNHQRVISLNIPDNYKYMDPDLIKILKQKVPPLIR